MELIRNKTVIYAPYMKITVKFLEKEEVLLNSFQKFLLEAIMEGASIQQIMNSTQLTQNVIESELLQMEAQRLISNDSLNYSITDVSKKLMLVSKTVRALNSTKNIFCVNLITGEIEKNDESTFCIPESDKYVLRQRMLNLDGISIEDNMEFFAENMETFNELESEDVQTVLSSIYVEFSVLKEKNNRSTVYYKEKNLKGLPCLIGDEKVDVRNRESNILIEARCNRISFSYTTSSLIRYAKILPIINDINISYPELISKEAKKILHDKQLCELYSKKSKDFVYDCTSGNYRFSNEIVINSGARKAQLILSEINPLNENIKEEMVNAIKNELQITSNDIIIEISVVNDIYKIESDLELIMEEV